MYSHRAPHGDLWLPGGASGTGAGVITTLFRGQDLDVLTEDVRNSPQARALTALLAEAAHGAADKAMQVLASAGYRRGSLVERLFRDVRATEIYQGTSEAQRMIIAKHLSS